MRRNKQGKFKNLRVEVDGILFQSKMEAKRYCELKLLIKAGEIKWFLRQVHFDLPGNIRYAADFFYEDRHGKLTVEDVKGFETYVFKIKKKLFEEVYPFKLFVNKMGRK